MARVIRAVRFTGEAFLGIAFVTAIGCATQVAMMIAFKALLVAAKSVVEDVGELWCWIVGC